MIQPQELRKGNWVNCYNRTFKVVVIECLFVETIPRKQGVYTYHDLNAIQLTEPILLKSGFIENTRDGLSWLELPVEKFGLDIYTGDKNGFLEVVISFHDEELKRVQYLHHLQNLVLDLTDKELMFEL